MKKKFYYPYFIIVLGILALFPDKLNAQDQDTIPNLYSIHVKQSFSSWGNCSSDPDFDYADIELIFNLAPSLSKRILSNELDQELEFEHVFTNTQQDKNLLYLYGESNSSIHKIHVHTNTNDIENDHDLYYELRMDELVVGEYEESHEASDPCNNLISTNREGYTMTTKIYIDDPIYISYTGDNSYKLEYENLSLKVDNYYENGHADKPFLQVALDTDPDNWIDLKKVIISPNSTINLYYEDIAGRKDDQNSNFYKWMGKSLRFRIVKTLKNNKVTTGNIVTSIRFYPEGLQYTILQTKRTSCSNGVVVYIKLENSNDIDYLHLDKTKFNWRAYVNEATFYNCQMDETNDDDGLFYDANIFKIKFFNDTGVEEDPFYGEPNSLPCELQLEFIKEEGEEADDYACTKPFTVPGKPEDITINQKLNIHNVNGTDYNLPSMNNPYVLLDIDDPYELSALRRPYTISDGIDFNVSISEIPTPYGELSEEEQIALNDEIESDFDQMLYEDDSPYKNYFYVKYKEWFFDQNARSPSYRINHPNGKNAFYIYTYHSHYHTHTCEHTHTHTHYCQLEEGKTSTKSATKQDEISDYVCSGHGLVNPDPHDLCDNTHTHIVDPTPDYTYNENTSHTHSAGHSHIHSHIGIHAHGENSYYDYKIARKSPILDASSIDISSTYNDVDYITVTTTGFKAEYIFRKNGADIPITLWTENDILSNVYPDKGIAQTWYEDFYAIYKEQWLEEKFGVKVPIPDFMVNQLPENKVQDLRLTDADGCDHEFFIDVDAPENPNFEQIIIKYPSDACDNRGEVKIIYHGGGLPPYVNSAGELSEPDDEIIIDGLGYGTKEVKFSYGTSTTSFDYDVEISSATNGITSASVMHQTCTPANGEVIVNVNNVSGTKIYTLTNEETDKEYVQTIDANSCAFQNLPAGSYKAEVEKEDNSSCYFYEPGIIVESHIFKVSEPEIVDATIIGGSGSVSISLENNTKGVIWGLDVASFFNYTAPDGKVDESIPPDIYNFTATHTDDDNRDCIISDQFEVKEPKFTANITIEETDDNATISISLEERTLISPYHFRLLNSSNPEVVTGVENRSFSKLVQNNDTYTLNMVYGANNIDVYTFDYPSTPITNGYLIIDDIDCPGGNGSIKLTPSGGIDGADMTISTDGVDFDATTSFTVTGGNFEYYIKDENTSDTIVSGNAITLNRSIINLFTVTIPEPKPVSTGIIDPTDVTCAGANDGKVSIYNLSGGSGTYEYRINNGLWTDPQTETTGLSPGEYDVYLQDIGNGCPYVKITTFTIAEPEALDFDSIRIVQPTCELDNGEIYVEAEGGNGYFQFDWTYNGSPFYSNNALEEDSIAHLGDSLRYGFYRLNITDNKNCTYSHNVDLDEYFNPRINSIEITDVKCYGESNGEVKVINTSGTNAVDRIALGSLNFTYNDTINDIANSFNNLLKGRYELRAIDDSSCISNLPYPVVVNQPDTILYAIIDTIVPALYKGSKTGKIYSTIYGGNSELKDIRLFDADAAIVDQQFERNQSQMHFDSLYSGNYNLYVIDRKGCTYTSPTQTVIEPENKLGFIVTEKNDAMCKAQTGSFTIEGFGGWGEYSYKRAVDNSFYNVNTFENLYAGNYIVSVQDKYGAIFTDTLIIYEPKDSLQATLIDFLDPTCGENGSLSLNLNGGVAPYKLFFDNSSDTTLIATPQNYTITNRPAGGYLLHIEDDNACKFELETNLSDQELINIVDFELTYPSTDGASDGSIEAFVKGGKSPLNFTWKELFGSALTESSTVLSNISSGYYELTVSEQDGCSQSKSAYLPNISDMAIKTIKIQHETSYLAQNGFAQLLSNLESLVNIEVISPENVKTVYNVTDSTADFYEDNNNLYLRNLKGGSYFVMATNNIGEKTCAEFDIEPYTQFSFDKIQINHAKEINDSSGTINIVVAGGAGGNSFYWEYLDSVIDPLNNNDNEFTSTITNAIAGNYRITVTDRYNNSISQTLIIEQPDAPLEITISEYRNETCKDYENAYVILNATGGWGDYQFKQDVATYYSNSDTWLNLDLREHYFFLTDKMGVVDSIPIIITEPDYLTANTEFIDSVDCKSAIDGNVFFNINGGTRPYRLALYEMPVSGLWLEDTVARNLPEGNYTYIFTDSNNCVGQDTVSVYMPEPDSLLFNAIDVTHTTCDTDNGAISVVMQGGTRPYQYEWTDFNSNTFGIENTVSELSQNAYYTLNVIDAHNCLQHFEQLISPSTNPIVVNIDTTPVLCFAGFTGTANIVNVTPAIPYAPYSFTWSNSDIGEFAVGYNAGIHSVTISDTNNCSTVKYFEVTQPDTLQIVVTDFKDAHCFGYKDGFIELQALGGVGNYQFSWSNNETGERIDSLYMGTYSVTLTDSNNCSFQKEYEIIEPDKLIVDLGEDIRMCPGNTIDIDGQNFSTHQWTNSEGVFSNERFVSLDSEDDYYLEVTDSIACFAWDDISISIGNDALQSDFLMSTEANLGDTLFIYELSNIELDSLYWEYSQNAFNNIIDESIPNYMLQLESIESGIYNVGLWAYSGGCISKTLKQVEIIEANDTINNNDDYVGYIDPLIKELSVYPNPTDGNFMLKIELREIADIQLVVFSVNFGETVDLRNEFGQDYYEVYYQLNGMNSGIYVIMVTADNERKQIKIIIE
ncbi:MAG: T9SS type A sorting domain-containing protein [Bacteroidales bacterium]|nr:T9SS type A sorting domain-containing protein [Bacteroidales bacterium]